MSIIVGDRLGDLSGPARGGNQVMKYNDYQPDTTIYGDVSRLIRSQARGGDDNISLKAFAEGGAYGDAREILDTARGGNDIMTLSEHVGNTAYGDAYTLSGSGVGGRDTFI
ncbi:MAG: calcium-binding protein, partial [Microvirga sp.]